MIFNSLKSLKLDSNKIERKINAFSHTRLKFGNYLH